MCVQAILFFMCGAMYEKEKGKNENVDIWTCKHPQSGQIHSPTTKARFRQNGGVGTFGFLETFRSSTRLFCKALPYFS
jgi:hypothetical protein